MKTLLTLIFVLLIGFTAKAQDTKIESKVATIEMGIVSETNEQVKETATDVARLYKRSNSRVKKALSFTTKRNKAKLA